MKKNKKKITIFNYESIPVGYYDSIYKRKKGIQSKWHHIHYNLVKRILGLFYLFNYLFDPILFANWTQHKN